MLYDCLGKRAKTSRKHHRTFPRFLCLNNSRTDCTKSIQYRLYFSASVSMPFSCCTEFENPYSTTSLLDCTFPRFLCLLYLLYGLLNPYSTACFQCCTCCLDFCASLQPWNACPSSAKMASSQARKCSLLLSLKMSQQPKNGAPSLP
jgi:hypothetical protein